MPRLIIDDLEIEVPVGTKVIEAAERLGIMIPRFCYHEGLGSVGACRLCAVKFLQGPVKGVQMSCMVDAQDGMAVSTTDEEAVGFRRFVIECLMLHHPHDCPVCDEGGQCLLQDETVSGGHALRRYAGKKRTYRDQYLGELIAHEMNRCIHCYRCSRFYQEFAGYRDLGPLQMANRVYFGRFQDGPLESPFSGNLVDICPTGVYTDKPARFKARRWDLQRSSSLCIHCSLGCSTFANARYREIVSVEARFNEAVNGYFICDRGRFGFDYANSPERPRVAKTSEGDTPLSRAVTLAAEGLEKIIKDSGPDAVACLGSARNSLETQSMLGRLCRLMGWNRPNFFVNPAMQRKVRAVVSNLDERLAVSLRDMEKSDFIVAVGVDPVNEAPMIALAMRQAVRKEAVVVVIDPRPVLLPFEFTHLAVSTGEIDACLSGIIAGAIGKDPDGSDLDQPVMESLAGMAPLAPEIRERFPTLSAQLRSSVNPVIVCGTDIVGESTPVVAASCSRVLLEAKGRGGLFTALPGPNAFGAGLLGFSQDHSFQDVLESIESGATKALIVVESDPFREFYDRQRLERAMERLELLLVLDYLPSETVRRATVFLPTTTPFEAGSSFINQEGRLQYAESAHHGGIPMSQESGGSHPPRAFRSDIPGGDPKVAWVLLGELARTLKVPEVDMLGVGPWSPIGDEIPALKRLEFENFPTEGVRLLPSQSEVQDPADVTRTGAADNEPESREGEALELLLVDWTFGTEELSDYSQVLHRVEGEPHLTMHVDDATRLGLSEGDSLLIDLGKASVEVSLAVSDRMARGTVILPRHHRIEWNQLDDFHVWLPVKALKRQKQDSFGEACKRMVR